MKRFWGRLWAWFLLKAFRPGNTKIGGVEVHPAEEILLAKVPDDLKPFELGYSRYCLSMKWDKSRKIANRKYFQAGWNSAIYFKAKGFVMTEQELELAERDKRK